MFPAIPRWLLFSLKSVSEIFHAILNLPCSLLRSNQSLLPIHAPFHCSKQRNRVRHIPTAIATYFNLRCLDSFAFLIAVTDLNTPDPLTKHIHTLLNTFSASAQNVTFIWIPGRIVILRNKMSINRKIYSFRFSTHQFKTLRY